MSVLSYITPARKAVNLIASDVSDTTDHAPTIKPPVVSNQTDSGVTIKAIPVDNTDTGIVTLTVPSGALFTFPFVTRRIVAAGSTGLVAGLTAGTVEVLLLKE